MSVAAAESAPRVSVLMMGAARKARPRGAVLPWAAVLKAALLRAASGLPAASANRRSARVPVAVWLVDWRRPAQMEERMDLVQPAGAEV